MKSIKNFILNLQIKKNSDKSERVSIIEHAQREFFNQKKNQPDCDCTETTRIPYDRLK